MFQKQIRLFIFIVSMLLFTVMPAIADDEKAHKGGVEMHHPKGWQFSMPKGDPASGRAIFAKFECYYCHEIRGENFPDSIEDAPVLSQMGPLHPLEFFAESIINPGNIVSKRYREPDGSSPMSRDHIEVMTLREFIDLTAYLASLRPRQIENQMTGEGKIIALLPETEQIVVDHEEIKGFMDAMVMGYKVASVSLFKGLKAGDQVRFTIDTEKRAITKILKLNN